MIDVVACFAVLLLSWVLVFWSESGEEGQQSIPEECGFITVYTNQSKLVPFGIIPNSHSRRFPTRMTTVSVALIP